MFNASARTSAIIIPFPFARIAGPQLTAQDRATLEVWEAQVRAVGYVQVTICGNDLVMIWWWGSLWTIRTNAAASHRFSLVRHATSTKTDFATLNDVLAELTAALTSRTTNPRLASPPAK